MMDLETRLANALAARAAVVPAPPALRIPPPAHRSRSLLMVAAAAGVVAIALGASLLPGRAHPNSSVGKAPAKLPSALVATVDGDLALLDPADGEQRVVSHGAGRRVLTIAGTGDGKTFYLGRAVADKGCASTMTRVEVDAVAGTARETEVVRSAASVTELALSPDGNTLAYVLNSERPHGPRNQCDLSEMHMRDLRSGLDTRLVANAARLPGGEPEPTVVGSMSWNADGSRLVFIVEECCDASASIRAVEPGRTLVVDYLHTPVLVDTEQLGCLPQSVVQREDDLLISAAACGAGSQDFLLSWDEQQRRATRLAVLQSRLSSMTYRSRLVLAMQLEAVVKIDGGGRLRRISGGYTPGW